MFRWLRGFLAGTAVGYIAGILLAPKSGEEMRRELAETSEDLITEASGYVEEVRVKSNRAMSELRVKGERLRQKADLYLSEVKAMKPATS